MLWLFYMKISILLLALWGLKIPVKGSLLAIGTVRPDNSCKMFLAIGIVRPDNSCKMFHAIGIVRPVIPVKCSLV